MGECGIPTVRNTVGERPPFALDQFVRDAVVRGDDLEKAREAGRQLLDDLREAEAGIVTTDAIRHWLLERDPLVFARRRCLRERDLAGRWRYADPVLGAIAALAETVAPEAGRLLTELFLDYFRPGAGEILFQQEPDERTPGEKAPDLEDLEDQFRDLADGIAFPDPPDFTGRGKSGTIRKIDPAGTEKNFSVVVFRDDAIIRFPIRPVPPECNERWFLLAVYSRDAPGCVNVNYEALVRAGLLQAIAEAFRLCRPSRCERAVPRLLYASWLCSEDTAKAILQLEVTCVAA